MTDTTAQDREADQDGIETPEGETLETRDLQPLRRIVPFLMRYPLRLTLTFVFLVIATIAQLAIPATIGGVIDQGFIARNLDKIGQYAFIIVGIAGLLGVASGARFYFISIIGELLVVDLRQAVFDHLMKLDVHFYDTNRVGDLTSRLSGDVGTIRSAVGSSLTLMLRSAMTIIGAVVMMFLTSAPLTLAVVVLVPSIVIPVFWYGARLRNQSRRTQDVLGDINSVATESFSAIRTVKAFVQEVSQQGQFAGYSDQSYRAEASRLRTRSILVAIVMFVSTAALVGLVWWGAQMVFSGAVTAGQLTQFLVYAMLAAGALSSISEVWGSLQIVAGATERLFEVLDTAPAIVAPAHPVALPEPPLATVGFENVGFSYDTRENEIVLHNVSFTVEKGEMVALVGPSGSGKSTLFALLQRFYDVKSGAVMVDGIDVRDVAPDVLRHRFAYVEQESAIFGGTIADNIRFGKREASDAEVIEAAKAALVDDFVSVLPKGYDTVVGERGVMMSGGQKQRIAIARALLKDRADPVARRGDERARRPVRASGAAGPRPPYGRPHHAGHRPPPRHHPPRRAHPGARRR